MQDFLLSGAIIVGLTLLFVSGIRKLFAKVDGSHRLDGKWFVFLCANVVGVGLSFAAMYLEVAIVSTTLILTWWVLVVRGAAAAATAFGYANWRSWVAEQLPVLTPTVLNPAVLDSAKPASASAQTVPDLILPLQKS